MEWDKERLKRPEAWLGDFSWMFVGLMFGGVICDGGFFNPLFLTGAVGSIICSGLTLWIKATR